MKRPQFTITDFTTAYLESRVSEKTGKSWYGWEAMEPKRMLYLCKQALELKRFPPHLEEAVNEIIGKLVFKLTA